MNVIYVEIKKKRVIMRRLWTGLTSDVAYV